MDGTLSVCSETGLFDVLIKCVIVKGLVFASLAYSFEHIKLHSVLACSVSSWPKQNGNIQFPHSQFTRWILLLLVVNVIIGSKY